MESDVRVLVLWADERSPNLGVRALARGSRELITGAWPGAEVEFADFTSRPAQVPWGRVRSLVRERVTGRLGMKQWLERFDLVWDTRSGDSLSDLYGAHRHSVMSAVHEFAVQAGRPVVMAPQTIGPFRSARGRALARRSLRRSAAGMWMSAWTGLSWWPSNASRRYCRRIGITRSASSQSR